LLLVFASPPPALVALNVGEKPTSTGLGVIGTLMVLLPPFGMGVLLVQVAVLAVKGSGGCVAVHVHGPLVKLAGAVTPGGKLTVVVTGPLVGATPMLLMVTGKVLGTVACNAGCGLPMLVTKSGVVATVKLRVGLAGLTLPAGSVAVAVTLCAPSGMAEDGEQDQLPAPSATAVQSVVGPSFTATVAPGSAVPLNSGELSVVVMPAVGALIVGAAGTTVSTLKVTGALAGPVPLPLVATASMVWLPGASGVLGVQLHKLLAATVVVQSTVPVGDSVTVISAPGVPMPLMFGWVLVIELLLVGLLMIGAAGGSGAGATGTLGVMLAGLLLPVLVSPAVGEVVPVNGPGVVPTVPGAAVTGTCTVLLLPLAIGPALTQVTV
jgi:hypothetical protein